MGLSKLLSQLNSCPSQDPATNQTTSTTKHLPPSLSPPTKFTPSSRAEESKKEERKCSLTEVQPSAEKRSLKPQLSPKPVIRGRNGSENLPYRTTLNRAGLKPVTPSFVKHIGVEEKNSTGAKQTLIANQSSPKSTNSAFPTS